jgi:hypothetical protein
MGMDPGHEGAPPPGIVQHHPGFIERLHRVGIGTVGVDLDETGDEKIGLLDGTGGDPGDVGRGD